MKSIGNYTFSGCTGLTEITFSDSVTSIGEGAFAYCSSLEDIAIPDNLIKISADTFCGCSKLTSITIPDSVIGLDDKATFGVFEGYHGLVSAPCTLEYALEESVREYNTNVTYRHIFAEDSAPDDYIMFSLCTVLRLHKIRD